MCIGLQILNDHAQYHFLASQRSWLRRSVVKEGYQKWNTCEEICETAELQGKEDLEKEDFEHMAEKVNDVPCNSLSLRWMLPHYISWNLLFSNTEGEAL